jgi:hypothetical protein
MQSKELTMTCLPIAAPHSSFVSTLPPDLVFPVAGAKANDTSVNAHLYAPLLSPLAAQQGGNGPTLRAAHPGSTAKRMDSIMLLGLLQNTLLKEFKANNQLTKLGATQTSTLGRSQAKSKKKEGQIALYGAFASGAASVTLNVFGAVKSFKGTRHHQASIEKTKLANAKAASALRGDTEAPITPLEYKQKVNHATLEHDGAVSKATSWHYQGDAVGRSSAVATSTIDGGQHALSSNEQARQKIDETESQMTAQIMQAGTANRSASEERARQDASLRMQLIQADTSVIDHVASSTRM